MSATNTTTNYSLPIFIETDKPAWLVDFNGAMRSIDSQMKVNADAIATKSPILTFNDTADIDFTKSGNTITANLASAVSDKVGRALVTPIAPPAAEQLVAINTNGAQAAVEIGSGLFNDNGTLKAVDLNLDDTGTAALTASIGTILNNSFKYALNADKSIGKLYGYISVSGLPTTGAGCILTTDIYVAATGQAYDIFPAGIALFGNSSNNAGTVINIAADGRVTIRFASYGSVAYVYIPPCLYFFKDFGDTPVTP